MNDTRIVLSPTALGISQSEHTAMLEVREQFASGVFRHDPEADADKPNGFNMDYARATDCGTTCCIGGWMWMAMNRDRTTDYASAGSYVNSQRKRRLGFLFYPEFESDSEMHLSDITPGAALKAIDSFLATGDPDWISACGLHYSDTTL